MATKQTDGDVGTLPAATLDTLQIVTTGPLPEAPVSLTVKLIYRGYDTMVTIRDHTGNGAFVKLRAALDWLEANGGGPTVQRPAQSAPPATGSGGPQVFATGQATGSDGPTGGAIAAEWYMVKPEAGGKARVEFWREHRDWPEIQAVKPAERLADFLPGLPTDFGEHRVPVVVAWTQGKAKANGNGHYQDIVRVHRA